MLVQIITGTTRDGRFSEKVADWVARRAERPRPTSRSRPIDLRDHPLPFFDGIVADPHAAATTRATTSRGSARRIDRADGFVVLTARVQPRLSRRC